MFCSECGHNNADDAKFCTKCGKKLVTEKTIPPSVESTEKPVTVVSQDAGQTHSSSPVESKIHVGTELKDSGTVTALSVIGLVFGLIGMLGSFIPCIGSLAFYVGIPAAIASAIALGIAFSQNAKRTFAIVALTISLIGVVISGWQYFSIISTGEKARKELEKLSQKSAPVPRPTPAPAPPPTRAPKKAVNVPPPPPNQSAKNPLLFIRKINAKIFNIGFFEGPRNSEGFRKAYDLQPDGTSFKGSNTRFIWWQMHLTHPIPNRRIDFVLETKWYGPSGNFYNYNLNTWIESNSTNSFFQHSYGNDNPGSFAPGNYRVEFYSQGDYLASVHFSVQ
jgi:hypothetical protein